MQRLHRTNFYFAVETASSYGCLVTQLGCKEGAGCHIPGDACAVEGVQQSKGAELKNCNFSNQPWATMAGGSQSQGRRESPSGLLFITRSLRYKAY